MSKTIGPYRLNPRGDYNPAADPLYSLLDLVSDGGGSFVYINDTPSNEPTSSTSHWQRIASMGGQDLVDTAVAARDAATAQAALAQGYAAQLAAGTASPAGTYANLSALITANPDHSKIYITLDDGKWCYHNGTTWVAGGVYQATSDHQSIVNMSETKPNMFSIDNVVLGVNWTGGAAANRAVVYIPVSPNSSYSFEISGNTVFTSTSAIEKAAGIGGSPNLKTTTIGIAVSHKVLTTTANTYYICLQFEKTTDIVLNDFDNMTIYIYEGETKYLAVDLKARADIADIRVDTFETFKALATARRTGISMVGGYLVRNIAANPYVSTQTQNAHVDPYYDVQATLSKYSVINGSPIPHKNILNNLASEEIDFTPADNGFTRIIVGKNSNDVFFVAKVASNRMGQFGDPKYNSLEITTDFVNFTTILRSSELPTGDGFAIPNLTNLKVDTVKEFSDGTYIMAIRAKHIEDNNNYTRFYRMVKSLSSASKCTYVDFDSNTVDMVDEFGGQVYDWHIFVSGNKALATTYGNRNPETDYGRVWYTENSGFGWKQIFQANNHYGAGVTQAHVHGVMIDPYTIDQVITRLYVIMGEDNHNIFFTDKGYNATDSDWTVIDIADQPFYNFQTLCQVVNGYPFRDGLIFGSDNAGVGCVYRINKLSEGTHSAIEAAHEIKPNHFPGVNYCAAEMSRRDPASPLLICFTHENAMLTEADNEILNAQHKARVVATHDGITFQDIWTDDTYGAHAVYINSSVVSRNYSWCTRGMNCWLLKNGDAVIKYAGRDSYYFGGNPMYSVMGYANGSCKVRVIHNAGSYL